MEIELIYCQFKEGKCSSDLETMESNISNSHSHEKKVLVGSILASEELKSTEKASIFVNHGEITWHEQRREWVGDQNHKEPKVAKDQVISWSMTYDDLLVTSEPFPQAIPLSWQVPRPINSKSRVRDLGATSPIKFGEMVDFLVDIWNDEGLYD